MDWGGPGFVIALIALCYGGWLINNWIRARHDYALEDEWGGKTGPRDSADTAQLRAENAELREQLSHFADRVKVLERIAADGSTRLAAEIEDLRK